MEPTNDRFEAIHAQVRQCGLDLTRIGDTLHTLLPNPDDRAAYHGYWDRKTIPHIACPERILRPHQFIDIVDTINFLDPPQRDRLLPGLTWQRRPWIPLGHIDTVLYRLLPSVGQLVPHQARSSSEYELLPSSFLGVNTNVQPAEPALPADRRAANLSEMSTQSAESDDLSAPGFVFHELDTLQYLEFDAIEEMPTTFAQADKIDEEWQATGFCVVARLDVL